jgi:hypothetical protein
VLLEFWARSWRANSVVNFRSLLGG